MTALGHHVPHSQAPLSAVKPPRFGSAPFGANGLDRASVAPKAGNYVMAQGTARTVFAFAPYGREGRNP
jgi:hypothetical protein